MATRNRTVIFQNALTSLFSPYNSGQQSPTYQAEEGLLAFRRNMAILFPSSTPRSSEENHQEMFSALLQAFQQCHPLEQRVLHVLTSLPTEVQQDFLSDTRFTVLLDNYVPGEGSRVYMAAPGGTGVSSRSVVLKPRLSQCEAEFAHYVIAHEFAHAHLRNGPWGEISNIEDAANALAASWGFPLPDKLPWGRL